MLMSQRSILLRYYKTVIDVFNHARVFIVEGLVKLNLWQDISFLLIASLVGIGAGYGAVLFHDAIRLVQDLLFVRLQGLFSPSPWSPYMVVLYPALGGLAVGIIVRYFSAESQGHGVPDVIRAAAT